MDEESYIMNIASQYDPKDAITDKISIRQYTREVENSPVLPEIQTLFFNDNKSSGIKIRRRIIAAYAQARST